MKKPIVSFRSLAEAPKKTKINLLQISFFQLNAYFPWRPSKFTIFNKTSYRTTGAIQHTAHRGSRGIALFFLDHGTRRRWGVSVTPRPLFTPGKTQYPLYRRLSGPQGRSGQVRKISPPPGFDPRTVQPVASRYTSYATRLQTET